MCEIPQQNFLEQLRHTLKTEGQGVKQDLFD
jgi:hypothetical protein